MASGCDFGYHFLLCLPVSRPVPLLFLPAKILYKFQFCLPFFFFFGYDFRFDFRRDFRYDLRFWLPANVPIYTVLVLPSGYDFRLWLPVWFPVWQAVEKAMQTTIDMEQKSSFCIWISYKIWILCKTQLSAEDRSLFLAREDPSALSFIYLFSTITNHHRAVQYVYTWWHEVIYLAIMHDPSENKITFPF